MKQRGVITVFLSLMLLLFLNFIMTVLEAARIQAGNSYGTILGENAVNTLEAHYYYPLFEQYGILAIDGGFGDTELDTDRVEEVLAESLDYAVENSAGGLISFSDLYIDSVSYTTLVTDSYRAFSEQACEEARYAGAELLCDFLTNDSLESVSETAKLAESQQETADSVTQVSVEILRLMQLVDGVCTTTNGLKTDSTGNYMAADSFTKKLCAGGSAELMASYSDQVIFEVVKEDILYAGNAVDSLLSAISDYDDPEGYVDKDSLAAAVRKMYEALTGVVSAVINSYEEAIKQAEVLEVTQLAARSGVLDYEQELLESALSDSLLAGFLEELEEFKAYVGLTDSDYDATAMRKTLEANLSLLQKAELPAADEFFTTADTEDGTVTIVDSLALKKALGDFRSGISGFSYENLKFDYGNLQASDNLTDRLKSGLTALFSDGVFSLLDISDVSDKEIDGAALPSKGKTNTQSGDILTLFKEMYTCFSGKNIGELLKEGYESLSSDFLMEVYLADHFSDYTKTYDGTRKLAYEREYILHGQKKDADNLLNTAMQLIALRAVFCFTALMTDGVRLEEAAAVAETMAVFGIPALITAAKYLIITVWAIEEAIIEVSALFAGKKVPVFDKDGNLAIYELPALTPDLVKAKAAAIQSDSAGIGYGTYIILLSYLQGDKVKNGRTLDIIQENIRYRYRDSFRIGNCLASGAVCIKGSVEKRFSSGFFSHKAYEMTLNTEFGYSE